MERITGCINAHPLNVHVTLHRSPTSQTHTGSETVYTIINSSLAATCRAGPHIVMGTPLKWQLTTTGELVDGGNCTFTDQDSQQCRCTECMHNSPIHSIFLFLIELVYLSSTPVRTCSVN